MHPGCQLDKTVRLKDFHLSAQIDLSTKSGIQAKDDHGLIVNNGFTYTQHYVINTNPHDNHENHRHNRRQH
jgi:hypothetical protein